MLNVASPIRRKGALRAAGKLIGLVSRLARSRKASATMEFAVCAPVLLTMGAFGVEIARMATFNMKVSQIAVLVGDNASRLGQSDNSGITPTISEQDVDSVMFGALQQGNAISLGTQGRIILTSLERDPETGRQYIHWQRCRGSLARNSEYGNEGSENGLQGEALGGMGNAAVITAKAGIPVMFVEIYYQYTGLFGTTYSRADTVFKQESAFIVRDDRNLAPGLTGSGGLSHCS